MEFDEGRAGLISGGIEMLRIPSGKGGEKFGALADNFLSPSDEGQ